MVNDRPYEVKIKPDEYLVDTLRRLRFFSVRRGCETTSCGICTVLVDDSPVASCSYLTARAEGHRITTVEGIEEEILIIGDLMGHEGVDQCGYCNPGFALTVYSMKCKLVNPTDDEIRSYMVGNLCRCSGYVGQHEVIKHYLEVE